MYDDIDRMQLELTDLDFAIRTSIDDYAEQEQKLAYEHSNFSSLKIRSNIELVGGGKKKEMCSSSKSNNNKWLLHRGRFKQRW